MNTSHFSRREDIRKVTLDDGVTLLTQCVPDALSVSIGAWVRCGSRDEGAQHNGITHFLEHMVFKGTERRSALEISLAIDRVGGQLDAFTTKELTCFSARVLAEYVDTALDVLGDMLGHASLDGELIDVEKQVVVEEIRNVLDDPDDLIHELASAEVFGEHPLGLPILGTEDTVESFSRDDLSAYLDARYTAGNVIVAAVGPLSHDEMRGRVETWFHVRPGAALARNGSAPPAPRRRVVTQVRELQQQHLWLGRLGVSSADADRYGLLLLSTLLGGSMSSRLFQVIRERAGLAYNIYSFSDFASDAGLLGSYMAVSPRRSDDAIRLTLSEYAKLCAEGCSLDELEDTKMQLKGNLLLAMESMNARMSRLARGEINEGRQIGVEELVARVDAVSRDDIQRLATTYLDPATLTLVSLGPNAGPGSF
ncbi:MAG: pitrilysin family protein [Candidatus Krumholzibacteriia bacterium]|nr:insulinase family protein [bacterium]MCB9513261.1 insulinase family protein [Candidatus Latescibacterota bacterium]MCB9514724.1 insulinase family protein [Candidatus Latescibacterota bacterium]